VPSHNGTGHEKTHNLDREPPFDDEGKTHQTP
jgi:hypothetical protein